METDGLMNVRLRKTAAAIGEGTLALAADLPERIGINVVAYPIFVRNSEEETGALTYKNLLMDNGVMIRLVARRREAPTCEILWVQIMDSASQFIHTVVLLPLFAEETA